MRVIIDTNVYVSYLLTSRRASPITEVLRAVSEGYRHDDYLIECARRANVDILVSADRDLLASNESQSVVEVMSPANLLDRLAETFRQES